MSAVWAPAPRLYTAEDLERLSAEGKRYELVKGELREMSPAGPRHGNFGFRLIAQLAIYLEAQDVGDSFLAETGFCLERGPDTVLAPDWAFVARERCPDEWERGFPDLVPDVVLEVRSPSDSVREMREKMAEWLAAGVRLGWVLDPERSVLTVYFPGAEPVELHPEDTLTGGEVLPGLEISLAPVFHRRPPAENR